MMAEGRSKQLAEESGKGAVLCHACFFRKGLQRKPGLVVRVFGFQYLPTAFKVANSKVQKETKISHLLI